jgi:hypothetical protein
MTINDLEGLGLPQENPALPVPSLDIGGVTVTITEATEDGLGLYTYNTGPGVFVGANVGGNTTNVPLNSNEVSLTRFLGGILDNSITAAVPIVFTFSELIHEFQLTTIDLLEATGHSDDSIALIAYDSLGVEIGRHQRTGAQGESGLDLDWVVWSSTKNISSVELLAINPISSDAHGFGIDDIGLGLTLTVPEPGWLLLLGLSALCCLLTRRTVPKPPELEA